MHKVLVVDDESNMRFLLRMVLETDGFEVVEANHGTAALERVKEEKPDLVVTDLMMPVMNGRELIERLHADAETAGIPILVFSANANAEVARARLIEPNRAPSTTSWSMRPGFRSPGRSRVATATTSLS